MHVGYICIFVGISFGLAVGSAGQAFADKNNVYNYARRQWGRLHVTQEEIYQLEHLCCNFIQLPPCCRFFPGENGPEYVNKLVCYQTVEQHLIDQFMIIAGTSMVQAIYLFVIFLGSLLFCKLIDRWPQLVDGEGFKWNQNDDKELKT